MQNILAMNQRVKIAIGLGSNKGERFHYLREAAASLVKDLLEDPLCSKIYESRPWGVTDQADFLNAVIVGTSEWKPPAILNFLKCLEKELGRTPSKRWGPREIDLDLLIYGSEVCQSEDLTLPHRYLPDREFVLRPLCDLWADWVHPLNGNSVQAMLDELLLKEGSSLNIYCGENLIK